MLKVKSQVEFMYSQTSRELGDAVSKDLNCKLPIPIKDLDIGSGDYQEAIYNDEAVSLTVIPNFEGDDLIGFHFQSDDIPELNESTHVPINVGVSELYDNMLLTQHLLVECDTPNVILIETYGFNKI